MAFAEHKFYLMTPQVDGLSLEVHLKSLWRQSCVMPADLEFKHAPLELEHVWDWWLQLNATRVKGMDVSAITFQEIMSWNVVLNKAISSFEVEALLAIDSAYIAYKVEQAEANKASSSSSV